MYQVVGLTCSFDNGMGLHTEDVIHNNLAGHAQNLLFLHVRPANLPTITGVFLCHKKGWTPLVQ